RSWRGRPRCAGFGRVGLSRALPRPSDDRTQGRLRLGEAPLRGNGCRTHGPGGGGFSPDVGPRPGNGCRVAGCYLGVSDQESWAAASEGGYNVLKTTGTPNRRRTPPVQRTSPFSPARGATHALLHHCSQPRGRVGWHACRARDWETTQLAGLRPRTPGSSREGIACG